MEENSKILFKVGGEKMTLSTQGLATCLALAVTAKTKQGDALACLGHYGRVM